MYINRECKNTIYVFSFLKSLIDCGIFEEIFLNFLPVGHTHCDIDQMFSRFSVYLKGQLGFIYCIQTFKMYLNYWGDFDVQITMHTISMSLPTA